MKMPYEYMAETFSFLPQLENPSADELLCKTKAHLRYIPHKKLYRYRRCSDLEFDTLQDGAVFLSNPARFSDVFDSVIPVQEQALIEGDYYFLFMAEIMYLTLQKHFGDKATLPNRDEFINRYLNEIEETILKYPTLESLESAASAILNKYGNTAFLETQRLIRPFLAEKMTLCANEITRLSTLPKKSSVIACFTTSHDNRLMWENYSDQYSGFCVEFDFKRLAKKASIAEAQLLLRLLPVTYFKSLPVFDHIQTLQRIVEEDLRIDPLIVPTQKFRNELFKCFTAKKADYMSEQEWRLILPKEFAGRLTFPFISSIYAGKNITPENLRQLCEISTKLCVPVYLQKANHSLSTFEYLPVE